MKQAILEWRPHPEEIEAGLLADGVDILDWHHGTKEHGRLKLSSRRLIVLIRRLNNTATYRRATSGSGWSELEELVARGDVEIALSRAAKYVGGDGEYQPDLPVPPNDRWQRYLEKNEEAAANEESREDTFTDMGFT